MNTPPLLSPPPMAAGQRKGLIVLAVLFAVCVASVGLCVVWVTGFFRLSGETTTLRRALVAAVGQPVEKRLALRVSAATTGLVRLGSSILELPAEAKAGLQAARAGEVGIYELPESPSTHDRGEILARADKEMGRRGWMRMVGVSEGQELVAVYIPDGKVSLNNVKCCVMVLHDCQLVLVSAKADLKPLFEIASRHVNLREQFASLR